MSASKDDNCELFWGLRGAGQNFGIVTSATFRIHDQTNGGMALNGDFVYPSSSKEVIFDLVNSLVEDQPNELSVFGIIMFDMQTQQTVLMMSVIYVGLEDKGMEYIRRFTAHNPLRQSVSMLPWNRLIKDNRFGVDAMACMKGGNHSILGLNLYRFDAATFIGLVDKFDSFYAENPTLAASILVLELFPNTITRRVPDEATAYPYRDALGYM